ncbi:MAG: ankyrin repeat protein [Planctomycetota bacterium]|jgi:ankyrin repeat protein
MEHNRGKKIESSTPLIDAVASGDLSTAEIEALIANGASTKERAIDESTVLHALVWADGEQRTEAWTASTLRCLLGAGADLEAVTAWGWTPLMTALMEMNEALIHGLLAAGANPNRRFSKRSFPSFIRGWSLAHLCIVQPDGVRVLKLLTDRSADLTLKNDEGETVQQLCEGTLRDPEEDMDDEFLANIKACLELLRGLE